MDVIILPSEVSESIVFPSTAGGLTFIEQLQMLSEKKCTKDNTPYLIGANKNEHKAILSKASCKCWDCETCGARNARRWVACIINGVNRLSMWLAFLTLTSHRRHRGRKSVACLRQGWKKLYNRILARAKKDGEILYFCRIWEQHKDGSFHLHILININYGTRWAKNNARACGLGHQADWRDIENVGMAAGYVAKYSLKNSTVSRGKIRWPKGLRRIEVSRNWPKLPDRDTYSGFEWAISVSKEYQSEVAGRLQAEGYEVIDLV